MAEEEEELRGVLVRGADGALYLVTEKDLAPFRVPEDRAKQLTEILENARKDVVVYDLSSSAIKQIQALAQCIKHVSPEIHL